MAIMTRTEIIAEAKRRAGRQSQDISLTIAFDSILKKMTEDYPLLRNICHVFDTVADESFVYLPSDYRSYEQCFYGSIELDWMEPEEYFYYLRAFTDTAGTPSAFTVHPDEDRIFLWHKPDTATESYFYYSAKHPKVDKTLAFTSGGGGTVIPRDIQRGDTVTGHDSGATMLVKFVRLTIGSWETGDAVGRLLGEVTGAFQAENLDSGGVLNVATIAGDATTADNFQHFLGSSFDEAIIEGVTWKALELIEKYPEAMARKKSFEEMLADKAGVKLVRGPLRSGYRGF